MRCEKMALLGQMTAEIAHEISTPLAAIKASSANVMVWLNEFYGLLPELIVKFSEEEWEIFFSLLTESMKYKQILTTSEEQTYKKELEAQLQGLQIENANQILDFIIELGLYSHIELVKKFLKKANLNHIKLLSTCAKMALIYKSCDNIRIAIDHATRIVVALKHYGHFGHGDKMEKANILEEIDLVLTLNQNQIKQGVEVVKHYQTIPQILCCPDELTQVWVNLIQNALYAMNNNGKLVIDVFRQGDHILVKFCDTGSGIADEIKGKIMEPFFTTKPKGQGSGLGLYIVKNIIDKHKGRINFESSKEGTTVTVMLPLLPNKA